MSASCECGSSLELSPPTLLDGLVPTVCDGGAALSRRQSCCLVVSMYLTCVLWWIEASPLTAEARLSSAMVERRLWVPPKARVVFLVAVPSSSDEPLSWRVSPNSVLLVALSWEKMCEQQHAWAFLFDCPSFFPAH